MASWSRRVLLLAALVTTGAGCPRASDPVPPGATGARPGDTGPALPTTPSSLTLHPSTEVVQWFDPPLMSLRIFDISGTPYFTDGNQIMRAEGDRIVTVTISYADRLPEDRLMAIDRVYGRHPSPLWFDRTAGGYSRTSLPASFRQGPDGRFVMAWNQASKSIPWDDDRMVTIAPTIGAMRWVDPAGSETPATLRGPSPDCLWQPGPEPVTSRGWVLTALTCRPSEPRKRLWMFDPSAHGRPIAGLDDHEPQSMIVLDDGETWFTAAAPGQGPQLCHLVGDHARCDKIPANSSWARSLGGRESALSLVADDGIWTYRSGTFHREPLLLPDGSEGVLEGSVRDRSQRLWGIVRERLGGKTTALARVFVRSP